MHLTVTDAIDPPTKRAVTDVIDAFNDAATGRPEPSRPMAVLLRDGVGTVQGGAWGVSFYDWLFVDLLWLPEIQRKQGWGKRIMRAVERVAVRRGCVGVWLDTMSFQAPAFYERCGYVRFATLADYTGGHDHFWYRKTMLTGGPVDADLDVDGDPDFTERDALDENLRAFNDALAGPANRSRVHVLLHDEPGGPAVGGLIARIGREWMFVELLALPESARRQGLGTRMIEMAEAEARARGCKGVWLDTFSFQAQPFYEGLGYRAFGTLPQYPGPHSRTLLAKRFDAVSA